MNPVFKPDNSKDETIFAAIPDPWYVAAQSAEPLIPPTWQFPLDPDHELAGKPTPDAITSAGPIGEGLLAKGKLSEPKAVFFLLQEELKLPVVPGDHLRDEIRDAIAYLELAEAAAS